MLCVKLLNLLFYDALDFKKSKHYVTMFYQTGGLAGNCVVIFAVFSTAAFLTQTVCLDDTTVKFEIWDTAGQERYHSLAPMYYRGAQAAIVVYDITNSVSFTFKPLKQALNHQRLLI